MRSDYSARCEAIMAELSASGRRGSLLMHACCAPCSTYVLEYLSGCFDISIFFYNPNMDTREEYEKRLLEERRFVSEAYGERIGVIDGGYLHGAFLEAVKGLESEPEGGARCRVCFEQRLFAAAKAAADGGFSYFTTTLTISPHKNAPLLNEIGERAAELYGVRWLPSDFKKKNGFLRSTQISAEHGIYRQNWCGCEFSRRQPEGE